MKLHLISLDVPYPPDYGGMVDVFYKVRNLKEAGVKIYLHCFEFGRGRQPVLENYCEKVYYYKRKTGLAGLSLRLPYMLYSRRDPALLHNLLQIEAPVLFEGVHCAYYLSHPALAGRFKLMRNQNLEQEYYALLARREPGLLRKWYYRAESFLLKKAERNLGAADAFLTVAAHDHLFFKQLYPGKIHEYIPSFQPYHEVKSLPGVGDYVLYHGNLGHIENIEAALFLLQEVCPHLEVPFVFAGKKPHPKVIAAVGAMPHCRLVADPSMPEMEALIAGAQVHALPTFQATGLKLKLLHALFNGRHVVVNAQMIAGTGLESCCHQASSATAFIEKIKELMPLPFSEENVAARSLVLSERYDNRRNAQRIVTYLRS